MVGTSKVLLVGEGMRNTERLTEYLAAKGCELQFAPSMDEALARIAREPVDLVLCEFKTASGKTSRLISALSGSRCSAYFSLPVEYGCWWIPGAIQGKGCLGAAALSSEQAAKRFEETILRPPVRAHRSEVVGAAA